MDLFVLCKSGELNITYLEDNPDYATITKNGDYLIHTACCYNRFDIIKYILERHSQVNVLNKCKEIPLQMACEKADLCVVKYLLEHGADVNITDRSKTSPLHVACDRNSKGFIIKYLVEHGADIHAIDDKGYTPLHYARGESIRQYLKSHGAIEIKDEKDNCRIL